MSFDRQDPGRFGSTEPCRQARSPKSVGGRILEFWKFILDALSLKA